MGRFNFMDPGIQSRSGLPLCGLAVTVNARPGDNLMVHKALQIAEAGDIVVVTTGGNTTSAVFGELMCTTAVAKQTRRHRRRRRDSRRGGHRRARVSGLTAARVSPGAATRTAPARSTSPISCGGTVVQPGDIVVGDRDGIAVVPRAHAAEVLELVRAAGEERRAARSPRFRPARCSSPRSTRRSGSKGVIE